MSSGLGLNSAAGPVRGASVLGKLWNVAPLSRDTLMLSPEPRLSPYRTPSRGPPVLSTITGALDPGKPLSIGVMRFHVLPPSSVRASAVPPIWADAAM